MSVLILFLPLLSFIVCSLLGSKIGRSGVKMFSTFVMLITSFFSLILFYEVVMNENNYSILLWNWFNMGVISNNLCFKFDSVICSMLILVSLVSFLVHMYSTSYMEEDPHLPSFMSYLSLFTFFMMILMTSNNLLQLFMGWEGVGLCSYLLINFWFTSMQANKAGMKAMIVNKVGDMGLLLGIMLLWSITGGVEYDVLFSSICNNSSLENLLNFSTFLLLMGVMGKSAQMGLHTWLPDAMEGPTPVSALMHAATMVTAGVFLIISMSPVFEKTPLILLVVILMGSLTAFFTSTIGLTQNDLKKVMAYSTCSQLGYMIMMCGFSQYSLSLFHLMNHGFFKALLFLSAGSLIHSMADEQDLSKTGSAKNFLPLSYVCMLMGSISLMGLPFLTGFYSKDLMLETLGQNYYFSFSLWLGLLAAFFTALYSFSLMYFSFLGSPQIASYNFTLIHESSWNLLLPLLVLLILSMLGGHLLQFFVLKDELPVMMLTFNKNVPFFLSSLGALMSLLSGYLIKSWWQKGLNNYFMKMYSLTNKAWYFDHLINYYLSTPVLKFGHSVTYKLMDNQLLELMGPTGAVKSISAMSSKLSHLHLGKISVYSFIFMIFVSFLLFKF